MTALIVVESSFGNTRAVAEAIRDGLTPHVEAEVVAVADAPTQLSDTVELLVVGGPTQAFGMSRPQTRDDAVRQGAPNTQTRVGLREWIAALSDTGARPPVVTFDTRTKHRWVPGSAASQAAAALSERGFPSAAARQSFRVDDVAGPLVPGEVEKARAWGERLGTDVATRQTLRRR
jgi:flavodoxin